MIGPSSDGLSYLLDNNPNNFTVPVNLLTPYPEGLQALNGNDTVIGSSNPELINGNKGNDNISGGDGSDTLRGGRDNDLIYANPGNDQIFGDLGNDTVYGEIGNDTIYGGKENDLLLGQNGDDLIAGDLGKDTLIGGEGNDIFVLREAQNNNIDTADIIEDFNPNFDRIKIPENLTENDILLRTDALTGDTLIQVQTNDFILARVQEISDTNLVENRLIFGDTIPSTNELSQIANSVMPTFNNIFGYGLVDASAAVASAMGVGPFPDVPDLGGNQWGLDLVKAPEVWNQGLLP